MGHIFREWPGNLPARATYLLAKNGHNGTHAACIVFSGVIMPGNDR
jgi:hypothetical protein